MSIRSDLAIRAERGDENTGYQIGRLGFSNPSVGTKMPDAKSGRSDLAIRAERGDEDTGCQIGCFGFSNPSEGKLKDNLYLN